MPLAFAPTPPAVVAPTERDVPYRARTRMVTATVLALAVTVSLVTVTPSAATDADLARLLRFMAVLKGSFAVAAFAAAYWRLRRPASQWREITYTLAPGLVAAGAVALWFLHGTWVPAVVLHGGLFGFLAAALTDRDFIVMPRRRS